MTAARLRAEILGARMIRARLEGLDPPIDPAAWHLADGAGAPVTLAAVLRIDDGEVRLVPARRLDPWRVHHLELPEHGLRAAVRRDPVFRTLYSPLPLGARVADDGSETIFRLFAPRATGVRLHLYGPEGRLAPSPERVVALKGDRDGVWEARVEGDLHRHWYDFTVHGPPDPGNAFHGTHPVHISDPWALVNDDGEGRSRVWRDGSPPPPVAGGRPSMEDMVAYEVHLQDFTDLLPGVGDEAGRMPAMIEGGLRSAGGEPVGFDHLVELGVNVVHLMPMQEYLHHPDEEWREVFGDDDFARRMGIDRENYQWGYRTTHAFAVEGRYRPAGSEHGAERDAFRRLVAAFHERGMAVVIDVVANHTGEDMDGRHRLLHFNVLDRAYWYRTDDDYEHIGPFGNEVKTEDRPMVQRWLIDQLRHWVEELGVDGFRFDLAAQIDRQTLRRVREELPADVLLYGEPWMPPSDPDVAANPAWGWGKHNAPISFFQDDSRNALQGSPFEVRDRGWAGGNAGARGAAVQALENRYAEEPVATAGVNYLDIHDNWALPDRYALDPDHDGRAGVDLPALRRAAGLLLTSAGPVVIHGGTEMLRSKGLAPRDHHAVHGPFGTIHFNGRHDTYNLRAPNRFVWSDLAPGTPAVAMRDWWRGLIGLRRSEVGRVFRTAVVPEGHYRFFLPPDERLLGYRVGGQVLVAANNGLDAGRLEVELPAGRWQRITTLDRLDPRGVDAPDLHAAGGRHVVTIPPGAFFIWILRTHPHA
ncbi:alpha-amylase family glycosyl hydrolase [Gaopeijia maritima]|uniref:alpha-amylase family glycosyl hydrolase n=1 Tax=Gaopeijia maritima TaxID=3119007 RepID=UPI0032547FD4